MALTRKQREKIIFLHGQGKTAPQIAAEVGCSRHTVLRWQARLRQEGALELHMAGRVGRRPCTSSEQDQEIVVRNGRKLVPI